MTEIIAQTGMNDRAAKRAVREMKDLDFIRTVSEEGFNDEGVYRLSEAGLRYDPHF